MPALGKFSAEIAVDNVPLPEYDARVDLEKSTVTCWIASEAGKVSNWSILLDATAIKTQAGVRPMLERLPQRIHDCWLPRT